MNPRILIVEDHEPLANALARLLEGEGFKAAVSPDGVDALRRFAQESFQLLVVDLHLPKLSGVEVIRKIRATARGRALPVVIISGVYKGEKYAQKARELFQVRHYLEKPFTREAFLNAVKESISGMQKEKTPGEEKKKLQTAPQEKPKDTGPRRPEPLKPSRVGEQAPGAGLPADKSSRGGAELHHRAGRQAAESGGREASPPREQASSDRNSEPHSAAVAEIKPQKAFQGTFQNFPPERLFATLEQKKLSGLLLVKRGDRQFSAAFINGEPASLAAADENDSFGNFLLREGKISLAEYQTYLRLCGENGETDELFIKMGALSPEEFILARKRWMEERLASWFGLVDAEWTFQVWTEFPAPPAAAQVNLARVIYQGCGRRLSREQMMELTAKARGRYLAGTPLIFHRRKYLELGPEENFLLDNATGTKRFDEIMPGEPEAAERFLRAFVGFSALGMVELRKEPSPVDLSPPFPLREKTLTEPAAEPEKLEPTPAAGPEPSPPQEHAEKPEAEEESVGFEDVLEDLEESLGEVMPESPPSQETPAAAEALSQQQRQQEEELLAFHRELEDKNYYEMFGMKQGGFDFTKLKEEYFRLTKKFSPENFITSSGEVLEKAEEVLSALATAYNTLSNVVSKEKYDEMLAGKSGAAGIPGAKDHDRMQAEVAYQSGLAFMEMGDWEGAEKALSQALSFAKDSGEIIAHYAYALYNKNRKSKAVQKRVQELLARALKLDPRCAPAFAYRGALMLDDDKVALAEADFKKALSLNPRYRFAQKGLAKIEARRQEEKKGLFARFRK